VPPRLLEGTLRDVLGSGRVAGNGLCNAENDPLEPSHECDREVGIARAQAGEQHLIGLLC
jgi:hypothetical protein